MGLKYRLELLTSSRPVKRAGINIDVMSTAAICSAIIQLCSDAVRRAAHSSAIYV